MTKAIVQNDSFCCLWNSRDEIHFLLITWINLTYFSTCTCTGLLRIATGVLLFSIRMLYSYPGEKPYTGKSDPNPEVFIALIPENNFLPSRSDNLVAFLKLLLDSGRSMTKPTNWPVRPAKTPISLDIRPVWSVFLSFFLYVLTSVEDIRLCCGLYG